VLNVLIEIELLRFIPNPTRDKRTLYVIIQRGRAILQSKHQPIVITNTARPRQKKKNKTKQTKTNRRNDIEMSSRVYVRIMAVEQRPRQKSKPRRRSSGFGGICVAIELSATRIAPPGTECL